MMSDKIHVFTNECEGRLIMKEEKRKKVDRRIRRTQRLLRDACVALILEKGYEAVTVEEIAERADVGRTTFYMHYRDKADLFVNSISYISEELQEKIAPLVFSHEGTIEETPVRMIFEHAAENADLYQAILCGAGDGQGVNQLRRDIARYARYVFEAEAVQQDLSPSVPIELITYHFVGALISLVQWWLENGQPYSPREMTQMLRQLTNLGRLATMGLRLAD
jgi:AcrR family transcriptional regulator